MKKRTAITYAVSILTGLTLAGPASAAVRQLAATPSAQRFYLDGQQAQFEAYAINGHNYVKLRDIGKAVDLGVTYDAATNSVHIDTTAHYEQEVTLPAQTTPTPSAITEESVYKVLMTLKEQYPHGTLYPSPYTSTSNPPYGPTNKNCAGWAILCSDAAFGDLPWRKVDRPSWEQIRPGDLIEVRGEINHGVIVLERTEDYILTTESGTNQKVYWGAQYFRWWLEDQPTYILYTRYPA